MDYLRIKEHKKVINNKGAKVQHITRVGVKNIIDELEPVATVEEAIVDIERADHVNRDSNIDIISNREHSNNEGSNDTSITTVEDPIEAELKIT